MDKNGLIDLRERLIKIERSFPMHYPTLHQKGFGYVAEVMREAEVELAHISNELWKVIIADKD